MMRLLKPGVRLGFFAVLFVLILAGRTGALDVPATSCSKSDVQSAITKVQNSGGGTVNIPAGDCTWSGPRIDVVLNGSIRIMGAGSDKTFLRLNPDSKSKGFFGVNEKNSSHIVDYVRFSGIGFYSTGRAAVSAGSATPIYITKAVTYRIDHNYIEGEGGSTIVLKNTAKGLIDNNHFKRVYTGTPGYDEAYGIEYGSCYTPYSTKPKKVCDTGICRCEAGSGSVARQSFVPSGNTVIARMDDANASAAAVINNAGGSGTGKVKRLYIHIYSINENPSIDVAAFQNLKGNSFTTRGVARRVRVKQGLNTLDADEDFTPFDVANGDYIGVYVSNCTLSRGVPVLQGGGKAAGAAWVLSGKQIPCIGQDFGAPSDGNVSIYAELYDSEGAMAACEANWDAWYASTDPARGGGRTPKPYDQSWVPGGDDADFVEDNIFDMLKGDTCSNWGNLHRVVWRYNTHNHGDYGSQGGVVFLGLKPGTTFAQVYGNTFNYTGTKGRGGRDPLS